MSIKVVVASFILLSMAVVSWSLSHKKQKPTDFSPSVPMSSFGGGYGPVERVLNLEMNLKDSAENDDQPVQIEAVISIPFNFDQELSYKWMPTENVKVISGETQGKLSTLKAGQVKKITLTVTGFSKLKQRHVAFEISGFKNGKKVFADGIVTSNQEKTFEDIVQNVERIKSEENE